MSDADRKLGEQMAQMHIGALIELGVIPACSDCPPVGYPTDETRCAECPLRMPTSQRAEK